MDQESVTQAVQGLTLEDANGQPMVRASHRPLETERRQVLVTAFPECGEENGDVVAVVAKGKENSDEFREFTAMVKDNPSGSSPSCKLVMGTCQITYEDLCPSECIEYAFTEEPSRWIMAQISRDALDHYRSMKFEAWRKMLLEPTCEAQFRRMLQIGVVCRLFDPIVFPTPDSLKSTYQVTDEKTGKIIDLPHPVGSLRVWDAARLHYEAIDPQLEGAPTESEKDAWWEDMRRKLREQHGEEYISSLSGEK